MAVIVVTCAAEGALYSPDKDETAPIRVYSDRRVRDDIYSAVMLRFYGVRRKWRETLSRNEYRRVRKMAATNRADGRV